MSAAYVVLRDACAALASESEKGSSATEGLSLSSATMHRTLLVARSRDVADATDVVQMSSHQHVLPLRQFLDALFSPSASEVAASPLPSVSAVAYVETLVGVPSSGERDCVVEAPVVALTFLFSIPERVARHVHGLLPQYEALLCTAAGSRRYAAVLIGCFLLSSCGVDTWSAVADVCRRRGVVDSLVSVFHAARGVKTLAFDVLSKRLQVSLAALGKSQSILTRFVALWLRPPVLGADGYRSVVAPLFDVCCRHAAADHASLDACVAAEQVIDAVTQALWSHSEAQRLPRQAIRELVQVFFGDADTTMCCASCKDKCCQQLTESIATRWGSTLGDAKDEEVIGNAVSYVMLACGAKTQQQQGSSSCRSQKSFMSSAVVGNILSGVSKRFDQIRDAAPRRNAVRVATLYATLFSDIEAPPSFDEFPRALEEWMEADDVVAAPASSSGASFSTQTQSAATNNPFVVVSVRPWRADDGVDDPDDAVVFFAVGTQQRHADSAACVTAAASVAADAAAIGKTSLKSDDPIACGMTSTKAIYDALCVSERQQSDHERARVHRAALTAIPAVLNAAAPTQHSPIVTAASQAVRTDTLVGSILLAAVNSDLPDSAADRVEAIVCCLVAYPTTCLSQLCSALTSNTLGVARCVEVWNCVGEAAARLSQLPSGPSQPSEARLTGPTQIDERVNVFYPPIRKSGAGGRATPTTRQGAVGKVRWRSRRLDTHAAAPTFDNQCGSLYAHDFVAMFLSTCAKSATNSATVPFVELAMLRSLCRFLQAVALVRHVALRYAEQLYELVTLFFAHASPDVRAQSWAALPLVMAWWKGDIDPTMKWMAAVSSVCRLPVDDHPVAASAQCRAVAALLSL